MSMKGSFKKLVYDDGRTKEAFQDSTDINKILKKAQQTGSIAHLLKYPEAVYGEFTGIDLLTAFGQIQKAQTIFADLPSEVRNEFDGDALKFIAYASDPENTQRLAELIPKIAEPGLFFPNKDAPPEDPPVPVVPDVVPVVPPVVADPPGGPPAVTA